MSVILDGIWPLCDHGYVSGGCPSCDAERDTQCVVDLLGEFGIDGFTYPGQYGLPRDTRERTTS